jgi:MarC family membrane protein
LTFDGMSHKNRRTSMTVASAILLLILVIDPLGNIPFFLASLKHVEPARQNRVILRELLVAFGVMILFLFLGGALLGLLQISEPALTIAGGVILFLIALRMVFPPAEGSAQEAVKGEPFIVPLAIPYVAGPSVLATELLLMSREPERWLEWLSAVSAAWLATAIILILSARLRTCLGERGLTAMDRLRLMGMVLVAIAVQLLLSGVERFVGQLQQAAP